MAELTHRIELTLDHRELILKYGYVSGRLRASLLRWPTDQVIRRVGMTGAELHLLIGDLSYSCNHDKTCTRFRTCAITWSTPSEPATATWTSSGKRQPLPRLRPPGR